MWEIRKSRAKEDNLGKFGNAGVIGTGYIFVPQIRLQAMKKYLLIFFSTLHLCLPKQLNDLSCVNFTFLAA